MQAGRTFIVGAAWAGAALVGFGICGCEKGISEKDINESVIYTLADVREAIIARNGEDPEYAILIDPRAPKYFAAGHLPGAANLRLPDVREDDPQDPELARHDRLIVYGANPGSAVGRAMFKRLLAVGYSGVRFYAGGLDEWMLSGGEIETSELPPAEE